MRPKGSFFDGGAVGIGGKSVRGGPRGAQGRIEPRTGFAGGEEDQVVGTGEHRRRKIRPGREGARELRLEIAGQEAGPIRAGPIDAEGVEPLAEERGGVRHGAGRGRAGLGEGGRIARDAVRLGLGGRRCRADPPEGVERRLRLRTGKARQVRRGDGAQDRTADRRRRGGHGWTQQEREEGGRDCSGPGMVNRHGKIVTARLSRAQAPASVATSCQFGSREPRVREKVQTSGTSTTVSALPSTTLPSALRVAVMRFDRKRTVT